MKPIVITYANHSPQQLTDNIERYESLGGITPIVLGQGTVMDGWETRVITYYRWCKNNPGVLVMHVDGFDTFPVEKIDIPSAPNKVIFGAEIICSPDDSIAYQYPEVESKYKYLNGGFWIGQSDMFCYLCEVNGIHEPGGFSKIDKSGSKHDQTVFGKIYIDNKDLIGLDNDCLYVHNLFLAMDDWQVNYGKYKVKSTGSEPFIVHGSGKTNMSEIRKAIYEYGRGLIGTKKRPYLSMERTK